MDEFVKKRLIEPMRRHKILVIFGVLVFYFGCRLGEMYRLTGGDILIMCSNLDYMIKTFPKTKAADISPSIWV